MKISGGDASKQKPIEKETNKISSQKARDENIDDIEFQLFQLMTGNASAVPQDTSLKLVQRVAKVVNMRDLLKNNAEKNPLSSRLQLVINAADQWIKAKKAEANFLDQ